MTLMSHFRDVVLAVQEALDKNAGSAPESGDMPVVGDWALIVAYEDASESGNGTIIRYAPINQWHHRTVGLLTAALEGESEWEDEDDERL